MFFKFIQTSQTGIVQTFGKFTRTVGPGLRLFVPFIQSITPVSNRLVQETFKFETKTRDNVFAKLGIAIQYQIKEENTEKAFFSLNRPVDQIDSYVENVVRAQVPRMRLDELYESQDQICKSVSETLLVQMEQYGFSIVNTLVTEIEPDSRVKAAMNEINATERLKEAAKNEADAKYIKSVREAEADSERKRLHGEGISQQRTAILKGYKEGIDDLANRTGLEPKDIIDFICYVQKLDALERIGSSENTKTLFMDIKGDGHSNMLKDLVVSAESK